MKKIILLIMLLFIASCWINADTKTTNVETNNNALEVNEYTVWLKENNFINIYWNIVNNNLNILTSNISWKITYLNCEQWKEVYDNTIISKIIPDKDNLSYKNNFIQIESYKEQLRNLEIIKENTILNFDTKKRQLDLQKQELENQIKNLGKNIWSDEEWIKNQLKLLNESIELLEVNKENSLKQIDDSINNLRKTIYNNISSWIKRLDEIFWITNKNKGLNDAYDIYIWAKNSNLKNNVTNRITVFIKEFEGENELLSSYDNNNLSNELSEISILFKDSANVIDNSIPSIWAIEESTINSLYNEFIWYSDWFIKLKINLDNSISNKESIIIWYKTQIKEIEKWKSEINTKESNLNSNIETIYNNKKNIEEEIKSLNDIKENSLKEIEIKKLSINQAIDQLDITFEEDIIYAWVNWIIKWKNVKVNNFVQIWTEICSILPNENWLKLEIYSPEKLEVWQKFNYYKDSKLIWEWKIISESPIKNQITQNLTYQGEIWFLWLKEWDYLDIKVLTEWNQDEIWIPISYVKPKLDWYYVNKKQDDKYINTKVEVWNMNNWEILIKSWLINWDILKQ